MAESGIPQMQKGDKMKTKAGDFEVEKKLGEGGFGAVYKVSNDKGDLFAMKVESANDKYQVLKMEVRVMKALEQSNARHCCAVAARGRHNMLNINYVVMTLVGPSLEELKRKYGVNGGRRFKASTALRVAVQTLESVEDMHRAGFIHRDVKPSNFAIGRPQINELKKIYILDFGLCREYRKKETGEIRLPRKDANFRGTPRYAPLNCHKSIDLSRKDDIETWLYMTIEFTCGQLPWRSPDLDKAGIGECKEACRTGQPRKDMMFDCPREYDNILSYIDNVKYWEEPDYGYIFTQLNKAMRKHRPVIRDSDPLDWEAQPDQ